MNCEKCKSKLGFLGNYGSDNHPRCFDCELIERKKIENELKRKETEQELPGAEQKNPNEFGSKVISDYSNEDEFEDYSDKIVNCQYCNIKLADSDENYGSKEHPLCKDCKGLVTVRKIIKDSTDKTLLFISYCLGIGSILVFVFSGAIWHDEGFVPVSPAIGLMFGMVMGIVGGITALIFLFKPNGKSFRGISVLSLIINSLMPLFFIGVMIFSKAR